MQLKQCNIQFFSKIKLSINIYKLYTFFSYFFWLKVKQMYTLTF